MICGTIYHTDKGKGRDEACEYGDDGDYWNGVRQEHRPLVLVASRSWGTFAGRAGAARDMKGGLLGRPSSILRLLSRLYFVGLGIIVGDGIRGVVSGVAEFTFHCPRLVFLVRPFGRFQGAGPEVAGIQHQLKDSVADAVDRGVTLTRLDGSEEPERVDLSDEIIRGFGDVDHPPAERRRNRDLNRHCISDGDSREIDTGLVSHGLNPVALCLDVGFDRADVISTDREELLASFVRADERGDGVHKIQVGIDGREDGAAAAALRLRQDGVRSECDVDEQLRAGANLAGASLWCAGHGLFLMRWSGSTLMVAMLGGANFRSYC